MKSNYLHCMMLKILCLLAACFILCPLPAEAARSDVEAFVTRFYQQCLGRNPDPAGLDGWVNSLLTGSLSGADVAYGFVFSDEFVNRNTTHEDYVTILYRAFFDREPDDAGYSGWIGNLYGGTGRSDVLNGFVSSQEFSNLCQRYGIAPYPIDPPSIVFNHPPVDMGKVAYILPLGAMTGSHVTPVDHQYYISSGSSGGSGAIDVDVYSPGDGVVISIQHMQEAAGDPPIPVDDFRLEIQHTSTVSSIFIHIDTLSDKLAAYDPGPGGYASISVPVGAGEVIGKYGGSVDYNVVDTDIVLGFINPAIYASEPWKIHCPDPFNYFNQGIKSLMTAKCLRTSYPLGGKIAYDIDGKMVGNWFQDGTNGYTGADPNRYWAGHLAIVYDSIDPGAIIVSIGTFNGEARQFAVTGNSPDPGAVSTGTGLVIYELVDFEYYSGSARWNRNSFAQGLKVSNGQSVHGVILLQLIENSKMKVEIIPGVTAAQVSGFSGGEAVYVR